MQKRDAGYEMRALNPGSRIPNHASHIPHLFYKSEMRDTSDGMQK